MSLLAGSRLAAKVSSQATPDTCDPCVPGSCCPPPCPASLTITFAAPGCSPPYNALDGASFSLDFNPAGFNGCGGHGAWSGSANLAGGLSVSVSVECCSDGTWRAQVGLSTGGPVCACDSGSYVPATSVTCGAHYSLVWTGFPCTDCTACVFSFTVSS